MTTLRDTARKRHLSQRDIAARLGVSDSTVSRWFAGLGDIPSRYMRPLAHLLGVPVEVVVECGVRTREEAHAPID